VKAKWLAGLLAIGMSCGDLAVARGEPADAFIEQLRHGGLILVFRHAAKEQAADVGAMLRELRVPTGDTYTSQSQPAVETARLARFRNAIPLLSLTDSGMPISRSEQEDRAEAVRTLLRERPQRGVNVVMVADRISLASAIDPELATMQEGELVVVRPDVRIERGFGVVGRLTLGELRERWARGRSAAALQRVVLDRPVR
jgi:hypothetical protein